MKKFFFYLCIIISNFCNSQVTEAVDSRIITISPSLIKSEVNKFLAEIIYDTVFVKSVSTPGNIDTISVQGTYILSVEGSASLLKTLYVGKSSSGIISIRQSNQLAWSGSGALTVSVTNNLVVVSTTGKDFIYKRKIAL